MTTSATRKSRTVRQRRQGSRSALNLWLIGGGLFFVVLIGLVIWLNSRPVPVTVTELDLPAGWVSGTTLGNPDAPVTVQAWEDFLCPACAQWTATIKPQLQAQYIDNGLVRLEFHQLPLRSHEPGASMAAHSSLCAADQNQFWPYHDALFAAASSRGQAGFTLNALVDTARQVGLDQRAFSQCMSSQQHRPAIDASLLEAQRLQLGGTPSLLINGELIENAFDFAAIQTRIDALLAD
jgi:protein-disulfide isomerase